MKSPSSGRSQRGQALIIFVLVFVVIVGFASLAIDGSHVYLVHRQDQNAADAGALAGTNVFSKTVTKISAAPASDADAAMKAVHDVVNSNGIVTQYPSLCQGTTTVTPTLTRFTATWFDTAPGCGATTGFDWKVTVQVPPAVLVGPCVSSPYNCIEVDVTDRVTNYLMGALGTPVTQTFAAASAYAKQVVPGIAFTGVPPTAIWLYEAQGTTACSSTATAQCFNRNANPTKTQMTCGVSGCPTLWVQPGTDPSFVGIDGKAAVSNGADQLALFSNGDMLLQAPTSACDPFNASACPGTSGHMGYAVTGGSNLYCSSKNPNAGTACTTTQPGGGAAPALSTLAGNETSPPAPFNFTPTVTVPTNICGGLILNGEAITALSFPSGAPDARCLPPAADPYTVLPGQYDYMVINHGEYAFERGLYDITGVAPVTTKTTGIANGIDHSNESNATDFDLCNAGTTSPVSCPSVTAGVWIGNGKLGFTPASAGNSQQCTPGQPQSGTQGGGGGPTIISGSGVSFRFESLSKGFVSTGEVQTINLDGPTPGSMPEVNGAPTFIDMENSGTVHLDAVGTTRINGSTVASGFSGLIFQTQSATAGGVELDPALSGISGKAALHGQVAAYTLTTFGGAAGTAVEFTAGYGTAGSVIVPTARNEPEIIGNNIAAAHPVPWTLVDNGDGTETYTQFYGDEWALDSYDTYFKINGGSPIFFSKGLWASPNPSVVPPNDRAPDDNIPAYPDDLNAGKYTVVPGQPANTHDWFITGTDPSIATTADPSGQYKFETKGFWTWGHEKLLSPGGTKDPARVNPDSVSLTFPKQSGNTVQLQGYLTDGDRCGDFATFDVTLTQPGGPGGGSVAVPGGQQLLQ